MPLEKLISASSVPSGLVYAIISRVSDGYILDASNGVFSASPADPYLPFSEDAVALGFFLVRESRTEWEDGYYAISIYEQAGGSPAPVADAPPLSAFIAYSADDALVTLPTDASTIAVVEALGDFLKAQTVWKDMRKLLIDFDVIRRGLVNVERAIDQNTKALSSFQQEVRNGHPAN